MTNLAAIVAVSLLTNVTTDIHQDSTRKTITTFVVLQRVFRWEEDGETRLMTNSVLKSESFERFQASVICKTNWVRIQMAPRNPPQPSPPPPN